MFSAAFVNPFRANSEAASKPPSTKSLKDSVHSLKQKLENGDDGSNTIELETSLDEEQPATSTLSSTSSGSSTSSSSSSSDDEEEETSEASTRDTASSANNDKVVDLEKQKQPKKQPKRQPTKQQPYRHQRDQPQHRTQSNTSSSSYKYPVDALGVRRTISGLEDGSVDVSTGTMKLQQLLEDYIDMETKFRQEQRKHNATLAEMEKLQMQLSGTVEVTAVYSGKNRPRSSSSLLSIKSAPTNILTHTLLNTNGDEEDAATTISDIENQSRASKDQDRSSTTTQKIKNRKAASCRNMGAPPISNKTLQSAPAAMAIGDDEMTQTDSSQSSDGLMVASYGSADISLLMKEEANPKEPAMAEHLGDSRQYWRDIILGVNDGLVSTFLLVAGVAGGGLSTLDILLTAIAGAVAGAVSMCAGEYVATKSQNEVVQGEIKLEKKHIQKFPRQELREVAPLLELIGITDMDRNLQKQLVKHYAKDREALLQLMIVLELGFLEDEERSPAKAGLVSFFLFLAGAIPSVLPFMIDGINPTMGLIIAAVATCTALLIVGAVKTWASKGNCFTAAMENLIVAGFGGAIAYVTGLLTEHILHSTAV